MHEATPQPRRATATERASAGRRRNWIDETDVELVESARLGCDQAWSELHRRYNGLILAIARRAGCRGAQADVCQRTWELFVRSLDTIRDPARIAGWLATTAHREAI